MPDIKLLKLLLNYDNLSENWNYCYGITDDKRRATTIRQSSPRDYFFHKNSETAFTLFMLGNIDRWKQINTMYTLPRIDNKWNEEFFRKIRNSENVYNTISKRNVLWTQLIGNICKCDESHLKKSILLFEFEILNLAFHSIGNKPFKELSFLDINKRQKWSQFDAILIIPSIKLFIFFEAKLLGYKDNSSKYNSDKPSQIFRNLESAYLLTNHEKSIYKV